MSNVVVGRCTNKSLFKCLVDHSKQLIGMSSRLQSSVPTASPMTETRQKSSYMHYDAAAVPHQERFPFHETAEKVVVQQLEVKESLSYDSIPTAKGLPIVGTVFDVIKSGGPAKIHQYCDKRHQELGPIFKEKLGSVEAVFIADSTLIQHVYQNEGKYPEHMIPEPWIMYNELTGVKRGLFFMDGPLWSQRRQSLNNILLRPKTIVDYTKDFSEIATDVITSWKMNRDSNGVLTDLEKELYKWSIESLGTMIFGRRMGCYDTTSDTHSIQKFVHCVQQIFVESAKMTVIPPRLAYALKLPVWRRFVKAVDSALSLAKDYVEDSVTEIVTKAKTGEPINGILSNLLLKDKISEEEIVRIVTDLFLAAADTTSHTTQWSLHLLAKHPECQNRLLDEIKSQVPSGEDLTGEHLKNMPYVKAIVKESLRMYPVAPFLTRILTKDVELGGYCIPKGKLVMMPLFTTCRNSKYFNSPDEFRPERWLRKEGSREVLTTHACLPFGLGTRSCVGRRIAETQMYLLLAKTVRDYELTSANAQEVDINLRLITVPSEPIKLKMTERRS